MEIATDAEEADGGAEAAGAGGGAFGSTGAALVGWCPSPEGLSKALAGVVSRGMFVAVLEHEQLKTARLTAIRTTNTSRD